jgi:hypothetical protein
MTIHGSERAGKQGNWGCGWAVYAACFHRDMRGLRNSGTRLRYTANRYSKNEASLLDLDRISGLLRGLRPQQEKVIRLYYGLGCQRPHSAQEMAEELGVSAQVIAGLLGAAQRRLAQDGLTSSHLREAARLEIEPRQLIALRSSSEPTIRLGRSSRCRHRS